MSPQPKATRVTAIHRCPPDNLLERIASGEACTPARARNLVANRTSRERRRRVIAHAGQYELVRDDPSNGAAASRLVLLKCGEACGEHAFALLVSQALGHTYGHLARQTGVNQNTLKVRMHRARVSIQYPAA